MSEVIDRLRVARERIRLYGWIQNAMGDAQTGACCAWAAICWGMSPAKVVDCTAVQPIMREAAREVLLTLQLDGIDVHKVSTLTEWNDDPYRTQEEVLAAFDATITRLEAA